MSQATQQPLRIILADDEAPARARLKAQLADLAEALPSTVVAEASTGEAALAKCVGAAADVILLDIQMPGISGLEAAQHIAALPDPPAVIFVTAYDAHALRAFDLRAVDYLLKPVRLNRLHEALSRIPRRPPPARRSHFIAQDRGRVWRIPVPEVLYLRAEQRYVTARTREREFLLDESLARLEEEFAHSFVRIHRNCLASRLHLQGFRRIQDAEGGHWVCMLRDWPEQLPVSRRQTHVVKSFSRA
ncbi:MAG TPA: LytTR family DNA-binding domain-containing protein [Thiobacillaceae bacterium]|nr:LytTR family DNA-binding domain-containing protein [Thiobacillaceae bacterium]HNU64866.1 LytTR family DNA-binding domain-containing protein [Thiobacillaceae bacterium]